MQKDAIEIWRFPLIETPSGGTKHSGSAICVLRTRCNAKELTSTRKDVALQTRLQRVVRFTYWKQAGYAAEVGDEIRWRGTVLTVQGPEVEEADSRLVSLTGYQDKA